VPQNAAINVEAIIFRSIYCMNKAIVNETKVVCCTQSTTLDNKYNTALFAAEVKH